MLTERLNQKRQSTNLYEQVANHIQRLIEEGTFSSGDKIPSVRKLRDELKVSISTVMEAYRLLEDRGLIEAHPQSGYYVRTRLPKILSCPSISTMDIKPSQVNIADFVRMVLKDVGKRDVVQLGSLQPDPELVPFQRLSAILAGVIRRKKKESVMYDQIQGYKPLRVEIAKRLLSSGCTVTPEEIIITSGCMEAILFALLATCNPGDTIAIESPVFFNLLELLELLRIKAIEIPCHPESGIIIEALKNSIEDHPVKACVVNPNFSTPLGSLMPDKNKQELVSLLSEHNIPLIEDDIYGDLYFTPNRPWAAKAYDTSGMVLLCSSFSKTLAPGYRVGWIVPGKFKERIELAKSAGNYATATPQQMAIREFLIDGGYDRHLRKIRREYARRMELMCRAIGKFFPENTRSACPRGGISLWVELPKSVDSLELYKKAHEYGISFVPGPLFSVRRKYKNFIRLNSAFWSDKIEKALATLGHLAGEMTGR
ncbi:MAG: PLP-dependent aminotransferase family protein [Spirochaetes bacterium]|nr:MAG: PLP-dependent aminotransferase family protein [Spirochaetota bacterium]